MHSNMYNGGEIKVGRKTWFEIDIFNIKQILYMVMKLWEVYLHFYLNSYLKYYLFLIISIHRTKEFSIARQKLFFICSCVNRDCIQLIIVPSHTPPTGTASDLAGNGSG